MGNIAGGVMHAKYFIVDSENLFVGSQNMDWRALIHIHELGVRVKNKYLANTFQEVFEFDWGHCAGTSPDQIYGNIINSSNPLVLNSDELRESNFVSCFQSS